MPVVLVSVMGGAPGHTGSGASGASAANGAELVAVLVPQPDDHGVARRREAATSAGPA
ncbi:hypothetical protein GHK86_16065 [Acidimicrobiaceae bacterium USS-CC1]|uniref:Uncharacterized protein n=1 Tax=Acidiferrimicrobium australe TaxID=2664430 RepID=A0ABW9QX57_9ACTN|nr:hypothetical protein [Acidiferrimicrobium australe]